MPEKDCDGFVITKTTLDSGEGLGMGVIREQGPENLQTCQSSFVTQKANQKQSIVENSQQIASVSEI